MRLRTGPLLTRPVNRIPEAWHGVYLQRVLLHRFLSNLVALFYPGDNPEELRPWGEILLILGGLGLVIALLATC